MSYNNSTYYKGGPSNPGRGGRGSFRSRGGAEGGSSWQVRGRGRGNFSPGVTRGSSTNWYNKPSTTFNRSYSERNTAGSRDGGDRFANRGGDSDYSHRYSRQDNADSYSSRNEHSHRSLDEVPRKRMRSGSYTGESNRRSHDGGYEYNSNRYEYSSEKSGYGSGAGGGGGGGGGAGDDRGRAVYRDDRRPNAPRRDEFSPRTRETAASSMPPPSQSYRGSTYRGRAGVNVGARGRGGSTRGSFVRRADATFNTPRTRIAESYKVKKRVMVPKPDFFKSKLQKLRSFGVGRGTRKEPEVHSDEEWVDIDKDVENGVKADKIAEKKKRPVKIVKKIIKKVLVKKEAVAAETAADEVSAAEVKEVKEIKKEKEEGEAELEEGEDASAAVDEEVVEEEEMEMEVEGEEVEEEEEVEEVVDDKEERTVQVTINRDSEGRAVSDDGSKKASSFGTRAYIKLQCPHCRSRCLTFKDYHTHLRSSKHISAMREVSMGMKQTLMRMRMEQRSKQRVIEDAEELQGISSSHTNFCPTCKLNYRQERDRHIASDMHKKMKDYLMPFCGVCHISFKSPMLYENHICSLDHIRAKDRSRKVHERELGSLEEEKDVDMDDLLILDSVGSADESGESEHEEEEEEEDKEKTDEPKKEKKPKDKKHEINLGADYVRKVQVLYCDLCEIYLPRREQLETALASHCRTRNHLQRYVRYRDDCKLRREAERIHRRDKAEQEARCKKESSQAQSESGGEKNSEKEPEGSANVSKSNEKRDESAADSALSEDKVPKKDSAPKEKSGASLPSETADGAETEEKIWADVDKGLEELLQEVGPGCKSSDEDEDSGRYDRFKYSKADDGAEDGADAAQPVKAESSETAAE